MPVDRIAERQVAVAKQVEPPVDDDAGSLGDELAAVAGHALAERAGNVTILDAGEEPTRRQFSKDPNRHFGIGESGRAILEERPRIPIGSAWRDPFEPLRGFVPAAARQFGQAHLRDPGKCQASTTA
jgi:hypothetical protein